MHLIGRTLANAGQCRRTCATPASVCRVIAQIWANIDQHLAQFGHVGRHSPSLGQTWPTDRPLFVEFWPNFGPRSKFPTTYRPVTVSNTLLRPRYRFESRVFRRCAPLPEIFRAARCVHDLALMLPCGDEKFEVNKTCKHIAAWGLKPWIFVEKRFRRHGTAKRR